MRSHDLQPSFQPDPPVDSASGLPMPPAGHDNSSAPHNPAPPTRVETVVEEEPQSKYLFARISVVLIMLMWVIAGFAKVSNMSGFVDTVSQHRVVPESMMNLLWWVGPGELVMGLLLVFVIGSELRKMFGKLVLLISMCSIGGFMYYLSLVDPAVLQESGCGCLSDYRIASGMENSVRFFAMGRNTILIILHLVALFGPAMVDSRRRSAG